MANIRPYYKKLNQLTQDEIKMLFPHITSIPQDFLYKYGEYSVASFPDLDKTYEGIGSISASEAYLLSYIGAKKYDIPKNVIIALYGAPGCGKSYILNLVTTLKGKEINEIKALITDVKVDDEQAYRIKQLIDSIGVVQKKTTRPPRVNETLNNPDILTGVPREEVQACDFTYEYSGNLYGIAKKDIDDALLDGHVIMIVNNRETIEQLLDKYGNQFVTVYVHRDYKLEGYLENMKNSQRTAHEIKERQEQFDNALRLYYQDLDVFPLAIINKPNVHSNTRTILLSNLAGAIRHGMDALNNPRENEW